MKHVAKTVANVDLSDHLISVIFDLFDEDGEFLYIYYYNHLSFLIAI